MAPEFPSYIATNAAFWKEEKGVAPVCCAHVNPWPSVQSHTSAVSTPPRPWPPTITTEFVPGMTATDMSERWPHWAAAVTREKVRPLSVEEYTSFTYNDDAGSLPPNHSNTPLLRYADPLATRPGIDVPVVEVGLSVVKRAHTDELLKSMVLRNTDCTALLGQPPSCHMAGDDDRRPTACTS